MTPADTRGAPFGEVAAKRPVDKVPLRVDWHDYLINTREPGSLAALNFVFRPRRSQATGFEYKCTTSGVTSQLPYERIRWPTTLATTVPDGAAVWTAQAISSSSLRATVASDLWTPDTGITIANESNSDLIYTGYASGGVDGCDYEVKHKVTLTGTPSEVKEALILLPVRD